LTAGLLFLLGCLALLWRGSYPAGYDPDLASGLVSNLVAQRMGDRSILPAALAAHPDYRFRIQDYLLSLDIADQVGSSHRDFARRRGTEIKDGWREFD
jgi:hypothetical protein